MKQRWKQLPGKTQAFILIGALIVLMLIASALTKKDDKAESTSTTTPQPTTTTSPSTDEFNVATALLRCKQAVREKAGFDIRLVRSFTGEVHPGVWRFRGDVESAAGESTDLIFGCDVTRDDIKVEVSK